jgi:hypothetical protein
MLKLCKRLIAACVMLVAMCAVPDASAQRIALKTNAIDWATLSPNLTLEARLSRRFSLQVGVSSRPVSANVFDTKLTNFNVEPELRYWFNRPMARHFIALSGLASDFNFRHGDHYVMGDAVAAGLSYGYALVLSRHWNMEAELGVGLAHVSAYNYHGSDKPVSKNYSKFVPVPVRIGLSFAYVFK